MQLLVCNGDPCGWRPSKLVGWETGVTSRALARVLATVEAPAAAHTESTALVRMTQGAVPHGQAEAAERAVPWAQVWALRVARAQAPALRPAAAHRWEAAGHCGESRLRRVLGLVVMTCLAPPAQTTARPAQATTRSAQTCTPL